MTAAARCAEHPSARAACRQRTGGATCGPCRCTPPAPGRSRRWPGRPPRRARSWPAAGHSTARAPTGPGPPARPLPLAGQDNLAWAWHRHAFVMPYPRQCPARRDGPGRQESMTVVATYPDSTKASLEQRLRARARERWPQIASLQIRHRGTFSYVDATLTDATTLKLCRLRYAGSASQWQFAIYRASHDDYDESIFPTGLPIGTCQQALDTACGLYPNDPTAWT